MIRALLVVAALATSAQADVWRHAIEQGSPDMRSDIYDSQMKDGDENALRATSAGASPADVRHLVQSAVTSYRNAAAAKPEVGEPFYKIGRLLYSFYFEPCSERHRQRAFTAAPPLRASARAALRSRRTVFSTMRG